MRVGGGGNVIAITCDMDDVDAALAVLASPPPEMATAMEAHGVIPPLTVYVARKRVWAGAALFAGDCFERSSDASARGWLWLTVADIDSDGPAPFVVEAVEDLRQRPL